MVVIEDPKKESGISKEALWAIIVILLLVVGVETTLILSGSSEETTEPESPIQELPETEGGVLSGNDNTGRIITQSPDKIPTLIPDGRNEQTGSGQPKNIIVNRKYQFPVNIPNSNQAGSVEYIVEKYGLISDPYTNQRILSVSILLINKSAAPIKLQSRDYLNLSVNNGGWRTPSVHNDPVGLEPSSSVRTSLGFRLNESDKDLRLRVNIPGGQSDTFQLSY